MVEYKLHQPARGPSSGYQCENIERVKYVLIYKLQT